VAIAALEAAVKDYEPSEDPDLEQAQRKQEKDSQPASVTQTNQDPENGDGRAKKRADAALKSLTFTDRGN
jgi:hypothetical protein